MPFKTRVILYALLPLTFITGAMVFITSYQVNILSSKELQTFRDTLLATKKRVVTNYISLAQAAIQPILDDREIDKESAKKEVKRILNNLKYGDDDGYFFVYDQQGINIVHPALKHVVGENLYHLKNSNGDFIIQDLLKLANNGGGFLSYYWHKPSTEKEQEKTSYVVRLDRWGWVLGTGFYMDDILKEVTSVENQVDVCQDTCPFFYAASSLISVSSKTSFSGFSHTSPTGSQFRVPRLHRSGFRCFAAW
ncbi:MAG TPA: hypothetical protein ENJ07_01485 [Gammaproteobacteria bacterium]|nr:hypothetical protein [Gammaproteobacteria bacterium]